MQRLGVDVGGTFTDLVLQSDDGLAIAKVASTPSDQSEGVAGGIRRLEADVATLDRFVHGTTVATNTALERDGARTVLVTTAGFRDLLTIGRQDRPALYDLTADRPEPVVPPDLVVEVAERVAADGEVLTPLTGDEVQRVVAAVRALEPEAIAISLLFGFLRPDHEAALADAVADVAPISRASVLLPVFREYERTSTVALNAYLTPRMGSYLSRLDDRLRDDGLTSAVEVMRSGGGTFTARLAARSPVHTLLSGPAAGAWGAAAVGRAAGVDDLIAVDMGGTSTDVTLIRDGRPETTAEGSVGGLPFAVTTTDIHTVGSGGGSIAWRDAGGALRVGPRSAGADPGPASYGLGGTEPTVTDANLVLGRLDPEVRLGGHMALDRDAAADAVKRLAADLGLEATACAEGILAVVEAQMAKAVRVVSVERGHDPRAFTLVAFGGAGALHQAALARELGCERVLVPPAPGVLSALGLLAAPVTADEVVTHLTTLGDSDQAEVDVLGGILDDLEDRARSAFDEQGIEVATVARAADLRYRGQAFELTVALDVAGKGPTLQADRLAAAFHRAHEDRYGYAQPDEDVELVNLRVRSEGPAPDVPLPDVADGQGADAAQVRTAPAVVDGRSHDCPVYDRARLGSGDAFDGPAIVVGDDATCFVAPGQGVEVDAIGCLVIEEHGHDKNHR